MGVIIEQVIAWLENQLEFQKNGAEQGCVGELARPDQARLEAEIRDLSHVAVVVGETTTGMMNPIAEIASIVKREAVEDAACQLPYSKAENLK